MKRVPDATSIWYDAAQEQEAKDSALRTFLQDQAQEQQARKPNDRSLRTWLQDQARLAAAYERGWQRGMAFMEATANCESKTSARQTEGWKREGMDEG